MTAETDIFRRTGVEVERDEQARQAVIEGRKLISTLTSYARALTKDTSVLVEMATRDNGSTDGRKIFWRPPIALGDRTPHHRSLCNKRGDNLQLLCAACEKREDVLVVIYHEIAHLCFDSFQQVVEGDRINLIKDALETAGGKWAKAVQRRIEAAPAWTKNSYISMASLINEYLPIIFNALEDARVNRELFKVRKGTKIMFDAQCQKVFSEGVEQLDPLGKPCTVMWSDYPLNSQVIVGLFAKASAYTYDGWFRAEVVAALDDPTLTGLVNSLSTIRSAQGVYHLGFPVLARLRELGFCKLPDDPDEPEDEPQPEGESDETSADPSEETPESEPSDDSSREEDDGEPGDTDSESGSGEKLDSSEPESDAEEDDSSETDEASDSGSDGDDPDTGTSDDGPEPDGGDGASSADSSEDDTEDEFDDSSDVGESGSSEALGEDSMESDEAGSEGDPDDSSGEARGDSPGEADSSEPQSTDESHPGTGSTFPSEESVDEEDTGDGSDSSEESSNSVDESLDGSDQDDGEVQDDRKNDDTGKTSTSEPSPGDSEGSGEGSLPEDKADDDPIDTGADRGTGGTEVVENPENDDKPAPDHGTPDDARMAVLKLGDHEEAPKRIHEDTEADDEAIDRAIIQGMYFETPSRNVYGVREHRFGKPIVMGGQSMSQAWEHSAWFYAGHSKSELGIHGDFDPPETVLGPALIRMRVAFTDNQRGKDQAHLKSGRVNGRVLGGRAWANDERLFRRRIQPGKKSYFVLIGMDVSGSTLGRNIILEKRAVMAQAELCNRMGIKFAVIAHSGNFHAPTEGRSSGLDLDMYIIKDPNQPWNEETKTALRAIGPDAANLDGHSLEYYRKMIEKRPETDKIIMYYSDGKMPAENHNEELIILQQEIKTCKRKNILLLGVGIRTDSPVRHGLDTVQVNSDEDIPQVIKHLEKRLSTHGTTG